MPPWKTPQNEARLFAAVFRSKYDHGALNSSRWQRSDSLQSSSHANRNPQWNCHPRQYLDLSRACPLQGTRSSRPRRWRRSRPIPLGIKRCWPSIHRNRRQPRGSPGHGVEGSTQAFPGRNPQPDLCLGAAWGSCQGTQQRRRPTDRHSAVGKSAEGGCSSGDWFPPSHRTPLLGGRAYWNRILVRSDEGRPGACTAGHRSARGNNCLLDFAWALSSSRACCPEPSEDLTAGISNLRNHLGKTPCDRPSPRHLAATRQAHIVAAEQRWGIAFGMCEHGWTTDSPTVVVPC